MLVPGDLVHPAELQVVVDAPQEGPEREIGSIHPPASQPAGPLGDGKPLGDVIRPGERVVPRV